MEMFWSNSYDKKGTMYRPIFRIVTVLYFWNQSQCDFFHISKPHPAISQRIGVKNAPTKIFITKTMDFNSRARTKETRISKSLHFL